VGVALGINESQINVATCTFGNMCLFCEVPLLRLAAGDRRKRTDLAITGDTGRELTRGGLQNRCLF
jgi:hypothetical protein